MIENLDLLENIWLKEKPFLCGDEISVSDLVAACEVEQPSKKLIKIILAIIYYIYVLRFHPGIAGYDPFVDRPNLTKWINRVKSKFSPFYKEAHEVVEQTAEEYKYYVSEINKNNT